MNELTPINNAPSLSSVDIANLLSKRHDNVKRTIETLAKNGVISLPQLEENKKPNNLGYFAKI